MLASSWRASGRSELWDRREQAKEFGRGHGPLAALVGNYVLTGISCLFTAADRALFGKIYLDLMQGIKRITCMPASSIVRSLAHGPPERQCAKRAARSREHSLGTAWHRD